MAVILKSNVKKLKLSWKIIRYSLCFLSYKRVNNINYSVIPLRSRKVNDFGCLKILCGNFAMHISASNIWLDEPNTMGVSLLSECNHLLGSGDDLEVLRKCISFEASDDSNEFSEVIVSI